MTDPLTIGSLAVSALSIAAKKALEAGVGEVIKDAYAGLKSKIAEWSGTDLAALEKDPDSKGRQLIVAEEINRQPPEVRTEIKALVLALNEALRKAAEANPIGIDVQQIEAASIALKATDVQGGTGMKIGTAKTTGAFTAEVSNVGESKR
ncbi:hypothetical protein C2U70_21700 [Bradyrhizobium guangdongense]|uniref:hypothetical protein n=1 Tax=Bradyrhizobium guangdongense TaxID=1325090 RepID=UPI00112B45D7|nr:hypothetical protein [Bradyrhizobium guangdongense]TPQ32480.1 hypothetical protein C2U70_21700 [Bradyrhizobium guangdongense]